MKTAVAIVLGLILIGSCGAWYWHEHSGPTITFRTAEVSRGDMVPTISASGTVEPQATVDVGAQINGKILAFGDDANAKVVDYRSPVIKGRLLAKIDDSIAIAAKTTADAQLATAQAGVSRAHADLKQNVAMLDQARSDWERAEKLGPSDALSQSDYNNYKAKYAVAMANVDVANAEIEQAEAAVLQAKAALNTAQQNLDYCTITSPVDGVIIDRRVNIGQTVVAGLNAPSLFLIAKDLTQMQIWVSVNEADIGSVYTGQPVTFSVDMFPGEIFPGKVGTIRLNASMTQNVVTYTVEVNIDNSSGRLLPYLTANVQFEVDRHKNVMLVPNAALRWFPDPEMVAPDVRKTMADKQHAQQVAKEEAAADAPRPASNKKSATTQPATKPLAGARRGRGTVWVKDGKYVRPVKIRTGDTDGVDTEIFLKADELKEGTALVVGEIRQTDADAGTTNPFAPQPIYGKKR